ncbi:hypothetical protein KIPB_009870, partial [Kipferlia bialata]
SDYPTDHVVSLQSTLLRRFWFAPKVDVQAKRTARKRNKHVTQHGPASAATKKEWAKEDRRREKELTWLRRLDTSKVSYIDAAEVQQALRAEARRTEDALPSSVLHRADSMLGKLTQVAQEKALHISVEEEGTLMGGMATCIFVEILSAMLLMLMIMFLIVPSPVIPRDLAPDALDSFYINQRTVSVHPHSSLPPDQAMMLTSWTDSHDSLYVSQSLGGDWGTVCVDYALIQPLALGDRLQVLMAASAGLLPPSVQTTIPTPLSALRHNIGITTPGCRLMGSGEPCDSVYNVNEWFDAGNPP